MGKINKNLLQFISNFICQYSNYELGNIILIFDKVKIKHNFVRSNFIIDYLSGRVSSVNPQFLPLLSEYGMKGTKFVPQLINNEVLSNLLGTTDKKIIKLIESLLSPVNFISFPEDYFNTILMEFNKYLKFENLNVQIKEGNAVVISRDTKKSNYEDNHNIQELDILFDNRLFHAVIINHSKDLFIKGYYFHAVSEAAKAFNKETQKKSQSDKDGYQMMMDVFSLAGSLKLNAGQTQTEKNVQEGMKFLSAGLMQAVRNPTAHENAVDWGIAKEDCLDLLSFISYLFKQLDKSVFFRLT